MSTASLLVVGDLPAVVDALGGSVPVQGIRRPGMLSAASLHAHSPGAIVFDAEAEGVEDALNTARIAMPMAIRILVLPAEGGYPSVLGRLSHHVWSLPMSAQRLLVACSAVLGSPRSPELPPAFDGARLPVMDDAVSALLLELDSPELELARAAGLIESDPGLAAAVLTVANSAFYGLPRRVSRVIEAARYVGAETLRSTVLSCLLLHGEDELARYAERLRAVGFLRMRLARMIVGGAHEAVVTAALLLDVGQLVMLSTVPDYIERAWGEPLRHRALAWEAEAAGVDRFELGAMLLARWRLPEEVSRLVRNATWRYPRPSRALTPDIALRLATGLADEIDPRSQNELDPRWVEETGLADAVSAWRETARDLALTWPAA